MSAMTPPRIYDVAIVGYGPAGATLANLLGQAGLSVLVLEKEATIYPLPRAIHFDGEVMRVFQSAGLRTAIEAISRPGVKGMHFVNALGDTLLIRGGTSLDGPHGCANNYYFHQPELESVLREGLKRFSTVEVRLLHEVTHITEMPGHACLAVVDLREGQSARVAEARAKFVVGCDGARSLVRKLLASPMKDLGLHQPWLVFDVLLKEGAPPLPDHTVQHCDPARPMTYCNVTGQRRRWEIMLMPGDDAEEMVQPETLWKLVRPWITPEHASLERAVIYTFHSIIAEGWRKGRLLLAGDAAHQTPPFLGQGMCAAIRDVANLAWKLETIVHKGGSAELLDTYESERSPHVHAFIELAVRLGDIIQTTDADAARARDAKFKAGQPEIFQFPSPCLGPGLTNQGNAPVGQVFGQPTLDDGRLMDQVIGNRFAIIARIATLAAANQNSRDAWTRWQWAVVPATHATLIRWLDEHNLNAVVLRPDRYIVGVATTPAQLDAITEDLAQRYLRV